MPLPHNRTESPDADSAGLAEPAEIAELAELAELHDEIISWYLENQRDLPWREPSATPWAILVSEVMLQQTPVVRVLPVWQRWMDRWPTPAALAAEPVGEAISAWERLGYPRRAMRLHAAATRIADDHEGVVPDDVEGLLALPGIGTYTAAAVAAFAFGTRTAVVDTNIRRVLVRAIDGLEHPAPTLTAAETRLAQRALPEDPDRARVWNVAVMELGALVCTARAPKCAECPIQHRCAWQRAGRPAYQGPARRTQAWHGTDRQVRGRIVQLLRESPRPVRHRDLAGVWDEEIQRERCLDSLVADGLVEPVGEDSFQLPGRSTTS